ncbi:MAG: response regulator [Patescibacteria group bacterium]
MARAIVVDDDKVVAVGVATLLRSQGHQSLTVPNAEFALEMIETGKFDLVIIDLNLGRGMTGLEMLRKLRQNTNPVIAKIPAILHTANKDAAILRQCAELDVLYFQKGSPGFEELIELALKNYT